ncbi:MAG: hypothetical protein RL441_1212 [Actinomycetota bacterium]
MQNGRVKLATRGLWQSFSLAILAAALRLPYLGQPHAVVFDETYYVKDAWSLLNYGYERQAVEHADESMLAGSIDILKEESSFVVHPPFGKWVIAAGEHLFGLNPFGWRIMGALLGVIAVILVHRIARRLFKHELTAFLAGMFMSIDGMAIVHSRTALLDQTLMFCVLAAFGAVVLDRDWMAARFMSGKESVWWRPWLIVAATFLALATATKWSGLWFVVACALLVLFFAGRNRIKAGHSDPWIRAIVQDCLPWVPMLLIVLLGLYTASWWGWLSSAGGYDRTWAENNPGAGLTWLPDALRSLVEYHRAAWNFHVNLSSPHSYSANPWTWPFNLRPTSFYYESFKTGEPGCLKEPCSAEVIPLGNPLIWWAGALAMLHQLWRALLHREQRAMAIVVMFLAGWAPWLLFQQRTVFSFYAIVLIPFISMALAGSIGVYIGTAEAGRLRTRRAAIAGAFTVATVALSIFFYPLWTGEVISYQYWQLHMWLPTWI